MRDKLAVISITSFCNHACVFCSEGDTHHGEMVPLSRVKATLGELVGRGYNSVNFMGAETTLHRDFPAILDEVHAHGMTVALTTNGTRLANRAYAESIVPKLARIEVSLPSADRERYRQITGRDHLDRVIRALRHIGQISRDMDAPCAVSVNTVVCRLNIDAPQQVAELLGELDLGPLYFLHLIRARPDGRADERPEMLLSLEACAESFRRGVRAARALGVPVMFRGLPTCCLFDEVAHNFLTLETLTRPEYAFLNKGPLQEGATIKDKENLDRLGNRYVAACQGCGVRLLCPGLSDDMPVEASMGPPRPCPSLHALAQHMHTGPLAPMILQQ